MHLMVDRIFGVEEDRVDFALDSLFPNELKSSAITHSDTNGEVLRE